jgi:glycosyltransferase involved in cell wall biosynthesis
MRIGHYAPDIWENGGVASYVRHLGSAQAADGHDVYYLDVQTKAASPTRAAHVVVTSEDALWDATAALSLDVLHLHKPVQGLPASAPPCVRTMHGNQGACPSGSRFLARSQSACDRTYSVSGCLWGHLVDGCGSRRPHNIAAHFRRFHAERDLAARLPTMTVSRFLHDRMIEAGIPGDRLHVVLSPAPIVDAPIAPVPQRPRFLFLGRIVPEKGLSWLLRALAQTPKSIALDVAGTGDALDDARALTDTLGLAERVSFHGWVPSPQIPTLLHQARAVVFPSLWHEPAGLVTLEAAAHGRAVIASRVGGIPEYAHPDFALLVAPNDISGLAAALTRLAERPSLAADMGQRGRTRVRDHHAVPPFLDRIYSVYAQAGAALTPTPEPPSALSKS